jgi:hypothetical protein
MKTHPIITKEYSIYWIIMATGSFIIYGIFGIPKMEGYQQYGIVFWVLSSLFTGLIVGTLLYLLYKLIWKKSNHNIYISLIILGWAVLLLKGILFPSTSNAKTSSTDQFEKSYKEQGSQEFDQYLDSTTNIYSNFKYHIAFDAPDNWRTDAGVSEHTIFRAYQPDSMLTFSINVIERRLSKNEKTSKVDIWELYQKNKKQMDYPFTTLLEEQLNTKIESFNCEKSTILYNPCLKRKFQYNVKDIDFEYYMTSVSYQTIINEFTYTIGINIPTVLYDMNPSIYNELFYKVYLLKDGERLDELLKNKS